MGCLWPKAAVNGRRGILNLRKEAPATPGLLNPKLPLGPGIFQRRMLASGKLDLQSTAVWVVPEPPAIGDQCAARTFHLPSSLTITCVARVR